jgi:hypothetical protein
MRAKLRRQLLILFGVLLIVGPLVGITLFSYPRNSRAGLLKTQDTGYSVRFATVTQGTNHVVFSGNPGIARLKWELYRSSFRSLYSLVPRSVRAQRYSQATAADATVLWVGWTHRDYKSTMREGFPQPSVGEFGNLDGFLFGQGGYITPLRILKHSEAPFVKEFVTAYEVSGHPRNLVGCVVVLRQHKTQEDVATVQLQ